MFVRECAVGEST